MGAKEVFNGKRIKVFTEDKVMPDGSKVFHEGIKHPGASLIVPLLGSNKIVFIRQYRAIIDEYIWELPAGVIDPGETPYRCAKREIVEETGFKVKNLKKIGKIYTTPGFTDEVIHIFKADCAEKVMQQPEADEFISVKPLERRQIRKIFKAGRINDSKTIAALAFAGII